jgi:hypothetical protein
LSRYNHAVTLIAPRYFEDVKRGLFTIRKFRAASGRRTSHRGLWIGCEDGTLGKANSRPFPQNQRHKFREIARPDSADYTTAFLQKLLGIPRFA